MAGDWIGWAMLLVVGLGFSVVLLAYLAAGWPDIVHWWRIRWYALRHAPDLIATRKAHASLVVEFERVRTHRDFLVRDHARLSRDLAEKTLCSGTYRRLA